MSNCVPKDGRKGFHLFLCYALFEVQQNSMPGHHPWDTAIKAKYSSCVLKASEDIKAVPCSLHLHIRPEAG